MVGGGLSGGVIALNLLYFKRYAVRPEKSPWGQETAAACKFAVWLQLAEN